MRSTPIIVAFQFVAVGVLAVGGYGDTASSGRSLGHPARHIALRQASLTNLLCKSEHYVGG